MTMSYPIPPEVKTDLHRDAAAEALASSGRVMPDGPLVVTTRYEDGTFYRSTIAPADVIRYLVGMPCPIIAEVETGRWIEIPARTL